MDVVFLDLEHNSHNPETVFDLIAHSRAAGITLLVRPPAVDYTWITRILDAGCQALLLPNLRCADEVSALLLMTRYHPHGSRGVALVGGANSAYEKVVDPVAVMESSNDEVIVGVVIETVEALDELPQMLQSGVDLAVMGYGDLAQSMGIPGQVGHERVRAADERLRQECRQRGVAYGVFQSDPNQLEHVLALEPSLVVHGGVLQFLRAGVDRARAIVPAAHAGGQNVLGGP
jgi:2-dehydro-3-deoxyglucarate aldolase/4-hydroxy-2-oxoheptanedioate aldolase